MKFTIAVGILAQTLPVISETTLASKHLQQQSNQRHLDLSRVLQGIVHKAPERQHGNLKGDAPPPPPPLENIQVCDPHSNDPDIGILSCGTGYECTVDTTSSLGGLCSLTSSRELQGETCFLCPMYMYVTPETYDIPIVGSYGVTCGILQNAAYTNNDLVYCYDASQDAQDSGCCVCDMCAGGTLYTDKIIEGVGEMPSMTCGYLQQLFQSNSTMCMGYAYYFNPFCCAPDATETPSATPSATPMATPTATPIATPTATPTTTAGAPFASPTVASFEVSTAPVAGIVSEGCFICDDGSRVRVIKQSETSSTCGDASLFSLSQCIMNNLPVEALDCCNAAQTDKTDPLAVNASDAMSMWSSSAVSLSVMVVAAAAALVAF